LKSKHGRGASPEQKVPFGRRLRRLRETAGLTQEELAEKADLSAKGISDLERGERR
jgi:transcriptional regulator with XRE-family HTH domain